MAITKKFSETDFKKFEADLLSVLKKDEEHKLDFDGKMLFHSRRYDCLLAATDVYWDERTGDIVLVGAFKSGKPVYDVDKPYLMKERVAVPLKECFEDLKMTSGMEMRLVGKARKAVIEKYINMKLNLFESRYLMDDGCLDLKSLGIGQFRLNHASGYTEGVSDIDALLRFMPESESDDGMKLNGSSRVKGPTISLNCSNSFGLYSCSMSSLPLADIQLLGKELERVNEAYSKAADIFISKVHEQEKANMSYSSQEARKHREAAMMAVYDSNVSLDFCNAIARRFLSSDIFDKRAHSLHDIENAVKRYRTNGSFTPEVQSKSL